MATSLLGTVHHVSFRVDDLDDSLRFYRDVLGCDTVPRPPLSMRGAWLQAGATQIHLIEADASERLGAPPSEISNLANHVAFHAPDLDAVAAVLDTHGLPYLRGDEIQQLLVRDPSGNVLEFTPNGG